MNRNPDALFAPLVPKSTRMLSSGTPPVPVTAAVTQCCVPTTFVALSGVSERFVDHGHRRERGASRIAVRVERSRSRTRGRRRAASPGAGATRRTTGTCAPENPLEPIGENDAGGIAAPSSVIEGTAGVGTTTFTKLFAKPVAGVVSVYSARNCSDGGTSIMNGSP